MSQAAEKTKESKLINYVKPTIKPKISSVRVVYDVMIEMLEIYVVSIAVNDEKRMSSAIADIGTIIEHDTDRYLMFGENLPRRDDNDGVLSFQESVVRGTRELFAFCEDFKVVSMSSTAHVGD
jgi:hypothetical protein